MLGTCKGFDSYAKTLQTLEPKKQSALNTIHPVFRVFSEATSLIFGVISEINISEAFTIQLLN